MHVHWAACLPAGVVLLEDCLTAVAGWSGQHSDRACLGFSHVLNWLDMCPNQPLTCCRQAPSATLVLAWERKIYLMDVPLAGLPGAAPPEHSAASRGPMALPPARVIKSWESEHVVCRCFVVCMHVEFALLICHEEEYNMALRRNMCQDFY